MTTINESITQFLDKYREVHSANTADTYMYGLRHFVKHLEKNSVSVERRTTQLKIEFFISFVSFLARSNLKRTSWVTYVAGSKTLSNPS